MKEPEAGYLGCGVCGKQNCDSLSCHCWNCGSGRKDRLRVGEVVRKSGKIVLVYYCSDKCLAELRG
jgi:hypothetical protein